MSLTEILTSVTSSPVIDSVAVITFRRTARASSTIEAPYSAMMSRSIAACFSPTSTCTPAVLVVVLPPGIRSRRAPNARDTPPPIEYTPEISRAAIPAIFCTTLAAMVVLPCEVSSASRAGAAADRVAGVPPVDSLELLCAMGVLLVIEPSSLTSPSSKASACTPEMPTLRELCRNVTRTAEGDVRVSGAGGCQHVFDEDLQCGSSRAEGDLQRGADFTPHPSGHLGQRDAVAHRDPYLQPVHIAGETAEPDAREAVDDVARQVTRQQHHRGLGDPHHSTGLAGFGVSTDEPPPHSAHRGQRPADQAGRYPHRPVRGRADGRPTPTQHRELLLAVRAAAQVLRIPEVRGDASSVFSGGVLPGGEAHQGGHRAPAGQDAFRRAHRAPSNFVRSVCRARCTRERAAGMLISSTAATSS